MGRTDDRWSWFGLGGRPRLPSYLRTGRGKRLKGLDEFEAPSFVGRMDRVERRQKLGWWALMIAGFAVGVGLGMAILNYFIELGD